MTVIAGEEFTITVPFTGNPRPKPLWLINSEEVFQDDRIKFDTNDVQTVFTNKCAKRTDSGSYTIQLYNTEGSDSATCRVLVVGESRAAGAAHLRIHCSSVHAANALCWMCCRQALASYWSAGRR